MKVSKNYYDIVDDKLENKILEALKDIADKTDDRTVASTCLQIQINAGLINEMTAVHQIDNWKDEHRY